MSRRPGEGSLRGCWRISGTCDFLAQPNVGFLAQPNVENLGWAKNHHMRCDQGASPLVTPVSDSVQILQAPW